MFPIRNEWFGFEKAVQTVHERLDALKNTPEVLANKELSALVVLLMNSIANTELPETYEEAMYISGSIVDGVNAVLNGGSRMTGQTADAMQKLRDLSSARNNLVANTPTKGPGHDSTTAGNTLPMQDGRTGQTRRTRYGRPSNR